MRKPHDRGGIRTYLLLIGLLAGAMTTPSIVVGTGLLLLGIGVQFWSKGCLHRNAEVSRTGPYRFVRHPFYFGNALLDAGIVVMSGFWPLILLAPIWWLLVYIPVMRQEEAHLSGLFGEDYLRYAAAVPRFVPWRRPLPAAEHGFSWTNPNILRQEVPRALKFLTYPMIYYVAGRLHGQGVSWLSAPATMDLWIIGGIGSLFVAAESWHKHFRWQRQSLPSWALAVQVRLTGLSLIIVVGLIWARFDPLNEVLAHWIPGLGLLFASAWLAVKSPEQAPIVEGLLALSLVVLLELQILAIFLVPLYLTLVLAQRLASPRPTRALPAIGYVTLIFVGVVAALTAEFL